MAPDVQTEPSERHRAYRAMVLGGVLGAMLAMLARAPRRGAR
jgi:hypothetical protein